jgi:3-deoxy-D-manno-octulosonic-acid transferase
VAIVESDLWPGFLFEMQRQGVPVALVDGRVSVSAYRGYRRLGDLGRQMFASLSFVGAQSDEDLRRLLALGADPGRSRVTGSMKFDRDLPPVDDSRRVRLRRCIGSTDRGRVLVAGSTHEGEEQALCAGLGEIRRRVPGTLLVVAPRDPARAGSVARLFRQAGFAARLLSDPDPGEGGTPADVTVVDRLGLLASLYAVADAAFIGGSLVDEGGHNPLEASGRGVPVLFGPHTEDVAAMCRMLETSGGAVRVRDGAQLAGAVVSVLAGSPEMGRRAREVVRRNRGAVERNSSALKSLLRAPGRPPGDGGGRT